MKATLQLRVSQHLTLTPQLQQAIRLLQLSTLELNQEIQQLIDTNPLVEFDPQNEKSEAENTHENFNASDGVAPISNLETHHQELPAEDLWGNSYPNFSQHSNNPDESSSVDYIHSAPLNLQEYLYWQMELSPFSLRERIIACMIIDSINSDGFLETSLGELQNTINACDDLIKQEVQIDEIQIVLNRIQQFEPIGCGSKDLCESLQIQLQQLPKDTPHLDKCILVVNNFLTMLADRNYTVIMDELKIDEATLCNIIKIIKTLHPQPGSRWREHRIEYITPDVLVKKVKNQWCVELNSEAIPKLRINPDYFETREIHNNHYFKGHLQDAKYFIKSLENRNETLLKVASLIVEKQQDFFNDGEEKMKPLVLTDLATELNVHASTISRITSQKYLHTPKGIFELKYFFSNCVKTQDGQESSSTAIRALIKKMIENENQQKPLSDSKLSQLLANQGIELGRRTITKYRETLNIPCSNERKILCTDIGDDK